MTVCRVEREIGGRVLSIETGKLAKQAPTEVDDGRVKKIEAIIYSMTLEERRNPSLIDGSRRRRIAKGSGTTPQDINQLLNQFREAQKLLRQLDSKRGFNPMAMLK